MKAEILNLAENKRGEVVKWSGVLCNRMEENLKGLQHVLDVMREAVKAGRDGQVLAEEAARRYLMNMQVLISVAGDANVLSPMMEMMRQRAELNKLADFAEQW